MPPSRVPLRDIKVIVRRQLGTGNPLRALILAQPDWLPRDVFLARVGDWLRLLDMEDR